MNDNHETCRETLRRTAWEGGTSVTVSTAPPIIRGLYPAEAFTCPHGVKFWIEPSGEQVAQWRRDGTA